MTLTLKQFTLQLQLQLQLRTLNLESILARVPSYSYQVADISE